MSNPKGFRGSQSFVWDISKPLGQGATSVVYMGRNKKTGDEVAVKVFNTMSHQRPMAVQLREFEVMKRLNNENIVKLIAVEEEVPNGVNVLVMEYCTHGNLYNLLESPDNNYGLVEEEFLNVLQQVTSGVKHLRDSDIIHRDIKPGNILRSVMPDGRSVYKLTDFGAARELQQDEEFYSLYGTDEYLHPDMYEKAVLRRARGQHFGLYVDLWSLGVTFYHAATGNLPFRPFGGRRNRDTMHKITAEKEHGVISGVQWKENGAIEWSRDLPPTCRLSRGLRALITPLLASLLEKDPARTISFEEFFANIKDITGRVPYHLFCPFSFSMMTVYARPQDDLMQIQQMVRDQTEIPPEGQLLLHDGKVLTNERKEPFSVVLHSDETKSNPIYLFHKLPEYKIFRKPHVGVFMDIPIVTSVDSDYPLSKKCLAVLYTMRNAVRTLKSCTEHMHSAVKMYCNYVLLKHWETEQALRFVSRAVSDTQVFKEQLFQLVGVEVSLFQCLIRSHEQAASVSQRANVLQTVQKTGYRECSDCSNQIQTKFEKCKGTLKDIQNSFSLDVGWSRNVGCLPSDKCTEKMDVLISRLSKIMSIFKEDRNKRILNNNEEQIHRVDKNKMKELTITAKTLLEDHCTRRAQSLFSAFKKFYSRKVQIHDTVEKLSKDLRDINDQQSRLIDRLKASSKECIAQAKSSLKEVEKLESEGMIKRVVQQEVGNGRVEKLSYMMNSIGHWNHNLEEVKDLLHENTLMISRMREQIPQEPEGDSKLGDWEMVSNISLNSNPGGITAAGNSNNSNGYTPPTLPEDQK